MGIATAGGFRTEVNDNGSHAIGTLHYVLGDGTHAGYVHEVAPT